MWMLHQPGRSHSSWLHQRQNRQQFAVLAHYSDGTVADVTQTADYYVNVLGFKQHWLWQKPATFGCVGLGKVEIFLGLNPDLAKLVEGHQHCFGVEDVDSLHEQHRSAVGAPMVLVELGEERLAKHVLEQHTLCRGKVTHAKTSVRGKDASTTSFYHAEVFVFTTVRE